MKIMDNRRTLLVTHLWKTNKRLIVYSAQLSMTVKQNSDYYKVLSGAQQAKAKDHRLALQEIKEACIFARSLADQGYKLATKTDF